MELWGWLIGYVVLFALLHLVLYYVYIRRNDGDNASSPSFADPDRPSSRAPRGPDRFPPSSEDSDSVDTSSRERDIDGKTVRCPHCGARNSADQTYTYCWRCVTTLRQ
ncbi:hypothetical protein ACLI4Z_07920 [Natrialbaceae archaeon A-arb3/5]